MSSQAPCRPPARRFAASLPVLVLAGLTAGYQVWQGNVRLAIDLGADFVSLVCLALAVTTSTPLDESMGLVSSAARPLRRWIPPDALALVFSLAIRTIPQITRIMAESRDAALARGLGRSPRAMLVPAGVRTVGYALSRGRGDHRSRPRRRPRRRGAFALDVARKTSPHCTLVSIPREVSMTFNSGARLDPSRIQRRGRSAGAGSMAIGGGIGGLLLLLLGMFLGVDLTGLTGGDTGSNVTSDNTELQKQLDELCQTGADANEHPECLVVATANSLDSYWSSAVPNLGVAYRYPTVVYFDGATSTGCGTATVQTGPFYCPPDEKIYVETNFFDILSQLGGSTGPLAQEYVIAHEYGHHVQQLLGIFDIADRTGTGANSDSVKVELMADCLAGVWTHYASVAPDANGTPFLKAPTDAEIADALSAAGVVGDDHIQEAAGGQADPDSFTHGTSDQRTQAFLVGYQTGNIAQCDPFGVVGGGNGGF